jgi:hypothetical protein
MRNSNLILIRSLVSSVILEGFRDDQARLAELYPEHADEINSLQPKWIGWLSARFGDSPKVEETHPFGDAIVTILNFAKRDSALGAKYRDSEQFRAAVDAKFPPEKRQWQSPNDVTTMSVDEMEMILALSERKKQRFEVDKDAASFEGDRVGKVGPWNLWMPTTRENSCNIVGSDPVTLEPNTTWCTARTSGSNLFYSYVGRPGEEITLFYVIRDEPQNDRDWLSVGFVNGEPVLDGQRGGVSVDRTNDGLTEHSLRSVLGSDYSKIMAVLAQKNEELGGKHPARQKISDAAKSVKALEYLVKGLSKEEADDLKLLVINEPSLSPEVLLLLSGDDATEIRNRVASNKSTPAEAFARLASDKDEEVRIRIAQNEGTPADILTRLASDKVTGVRASVARNTSAPAEALNRLSSDDTRTRMYVADNENTPADILARLASDEVAAVRFYVADNKNAPADILTKLASDVNYDVRASVAKNINTPLKILIKLASDKDDDVRMNVAGNPSTPVKVLASLASDKVPIVRQQLAKNTNTPSETLSKLAYDTGNISLTAYENPSTPIETLRRIAQDPKTAFWVVDKILDNIKRREATNESLLRSLIRRII